MKCFECSKPITLKVKQCPYCKKKFCSDFCESEHSYSIHLRKTITSTNHENTNKVKSPYITNGILNKSNTIKYDSIFELKNFTLEIENGKPKLIGQGAYGHVFLAKNNINNNFYVLKHMEKQKIIKNLGNMDKIYNEINIQSRIDHPNIIKLLYCEESEKYFDLVMEYANKDTLLSIINKKQGLTEKQTFIYFIQILNAIYFLHQNNIIHRDIKPENILIFNNDIAKLSDFGCCINILDNKPRETFCGTIDYMAPEIFAKKQYSKEIDMWSLGVLLYEMLHGDKPFTPNKFYFTEKDIMKNIIMNKYSCAKFISKECKDLIGHLLEVNRNQRYKIEDIYKSNFVKIYERKKILLSKSKSLSKEKIIKNNNIDIEKIKNNTVNNLEVFENFEVNNELQCRSLKETSINNNNLNKPINKKLYLTKRPKSFRNSDNNTLKTYLLQSNKKNEKNECKEIFIKLIDKQKADKSSFHNSSKPPKTNNTSRISQQIYSKPLLNFTSSISKEFYNDNKEIVYRNNNSKNNNSSSLFNLKKKNNTDNVIISKKINSTKNTPNFNSNNIQSTNEQKFDDNLISPIKIKNANFNKAYKNLIGFDKNKSKKKYKCNLTKNKKEVNKIEKNMNLYKSHTKKNSRIFKNNTKTEKMEKLNLNLCKNNAPKLKNCIKYNSFRATEAPKIKIIKIIKNNIRGDLDSNPDDDEGGDEINDTPKKSNDLNRINPKVLINMFNNEKASFTYRK